MTTSEKLEEAMHCMHNAERLIQKAKEANYSLERYCRYSLNIIPQEFVRFSDNRAEYPGHNTGLQQIMDAEGKKWNSTEINLEKKRQETVRLNKHFHQKGLNSISHLKIFRS